MSLASISGSISVGKSSISKLLEKDASGFNIIVENVSNLCFLPKFYSDPRKYGFASRIEFLCHKAEDMIEASQKNGLSVLDRSIDELPIFARVLNKIGVFPDDEYQLYKRNYQLLTRSVPKIDAVVFLRCAPEASLRRIKQRAREFEQGIELSYLAELDQSYECWFGSLSISKKLIIDTTSLSIEESYLSAKEWLKCL